MQAYLPPEVINPCSVHLQFQKLDKWQKRQDLFSGDAQTEVFSLHKAIW